MLTTKRNGGNTRRWASRALWAAPAIIAVTVLLLHVGPRGASADAAAHSQATLAKLKSDFVRPKATPFPSNDPYSQAKAHLGELLFWDPILSGNGTQSCASCHNPGLSWTDGLRLGVGTQEMKTHTPTLLNIAWAPILGWDGHFPSLEAVAFAGPITNPGIMNRKPADLIHALSAIPGYRAAFTAAFSDHAITEAHIADALATFERTIVSGPAPFDRWIDGDDRAIDAQAKRGFVLFTGKAGCSNCHIGWAFTDEGFYDVGTATGADIGRARLFSNTVKLKYAFKVPTLRDVARRAPYMHNGSEATLADVIDLYDRGGIDRPSRADFIKPLHLTADEKADLIAFLDTLTSDPKPVEVPVLPR
ncbi:MAG: cytochrome c peroxidase [Stellaceae bacterium]